MIEGVEREAGVAGKDAGHLAERGPAGVAGAAVDEPDGAHLGADRREHA